MSPVMIDYIVRPREAPRGWDGMNHAVVNADVTNARQRRVIVVASIAAPHELKRLVEAFSCEDKTFQVVAIASPTQEGRPVFMWNHFVVAAKADLDPALKLYNWENIPVRGVPAK
jgi:hypothetical protein